MPNSSPGAGLAGHPERIGPYRIRRILGEGGMGIVYEADQTEPLNRLVALKLIKLGMDTVEVVGRFATERRALAVMDHPTIAKAFDAGATEQGRPYFVMELVRGVPITEYCDTHKLGTRARIQLFIEICHGVQHAHQKGVIHRDLKPSNLLVMLQDDKPFPKIIDFGIAKAMDNRLSDRSFATELGQLVGTPAYMSPEQAEMSGLDIDTRSDIYSLGIVLYELLAGTLPFDPGALDRGDMVAQYVLREQDAPTPSNRFDSLGGLRNHVAQLRHTTAPELRKELKGDLDWIVLKAIAKDRTRRYESASAFAADLQRLLDNEPISARPPSTAYRVRKFVRRNRLVVAAGTVAVLALAGGSIGLALLATKAAHARDRAELEAAKAKSINDFMIEMLSSADPWVGTGRHVTVEEALEQATRKLPTSFKDQPLVLSSVQQAIGSAYLGLGRQKDAEPLLLSALELRRRTLGDEHEEIADAMSAVAGLRRDQGTYDSADAAFTEALAIRRRLSGGQDNDLVALSLVNLAELKGLMGNWSQADSIGREALAMRRRLMPEDSFPVAAAKRLVGGFNMMLGNYAVAESLARSAVESMRRSMDPNHPQLSTAINDLALTRMYQQDYVEAETLAREVVRMDSVALGPAHPTLAANLENLGNIFYSSGRYAEALEMLRQAMNIRKAALGENHELIARSTFNMASVTSTMGDYIRAEPLYEESVDRFRASLGQDHPMTIQALVGTGRNLVEMRQYARAEPLLREAMQRGEAVAGRSAALDNSGMWLIRLLSRTRRAAEAERLGRELYRVRDSMNGPGDGYTRATAGLLDSVYLQLNRPADAVAYREKAKAP
jgi:serine/threonine protein kinase